MSWKSELALRGVLLRLQTSVAFSAFPRSNRGLIEGFSCSVSSELKRDFSALERLRPHLTINIAESFTMHLKVIFEPSEEGGYTVYVPALPGCISEGDTLDEARANIREAIALWSEDEAESALPEGAVVEEIAV